MLYDPFWFQSTLSWAGCCQNDGPKGILAQSLSLCTCDSHGKGTKAEVRLMSQLTERGETGIFSRCHHRILGLERTAGPWDMSQRCPKKNKTGSQSLEPSKRAQLGSHPDCSPIGHSVPPPTHRCGSHQGDLLQKLIEAHSPWAPHS